MTQRKKEKEIEKIKEIERIEILPTDLRYREKGITLITEPTKTSTAYE